MLARSTIMMITAAQVLCTAGARAEDDAVPVPDLTAGALPVAALGAVQPLFVSPPDESEVALSRRAFSDAARKLGLLPVETIDAPTAPAANAPASLRDGIAATRKLDFDRALSLLDQAAAEVEIRGGAGLSPAEIGDLYFHRGWAREHADWKTEPAAIDAATERQAAADYLRAALIQPGRTVSQHDVPPRALESWKKALADVDARPRAALVVSAPAGALIAVDGGKTVAAPATLDGLVQGPHLVRIDETGRATWSTTVEVVAPRTELKVPARETMSLPTAAAARSARRMGARWAIVAEPRLYDGQPALELRLVDTNGGVVATSAARVSGEPGSTEASLVGLVNEAHRLELAGTGPIPTPISAAAPPAALLPPDTAAPSPTASPRATFGEDPGLWARQHWPLLTAIGVALSTALVLGIAVSADSSAK